MRTRPARPARSQKAQHTVAALIPALIVVLSITGFVWAQQPVKVVVDGRPTVVRTQARDVADMLTEQGISVGRDDIVTPVANTHLTAGMTVTVRRAVPVTLRIGGQVTSISVIGRTVADALVAAGFDPSKNLAVEPSLTATLTPNMTITAPDAFVRIDQRRIPLAPSTVFRKDPSLPLGEKAVVSNGKPGVQLCVWRTVVSNGEPGQPALSAQAVVEPAKPRVIAVGTAATISQLVDISQTATASRVVPQDGRKLTVFATGYSDAEPYTTGTTCTGDRCRHGVIAVDPKVIPLGTRLYVPGYGYGVACDTGGMINGNHVDLYFDTLAEMNAWGARTVTIIVLD